MYLLLKAQKNNKVMFVEEADEKGIQAFRQEQNNEDLSCCVCMFDGPDCTAARTYRLYFKITSPDLEKTHRSALEACYYTNENFNVPEDCIEIMFNSSRKEAKDGPAAVGLLILIPPVVFDSFSTPLMPAINYQLARLMVDDGITVDIDVYQRYYFIPLPNSLRNGKYIIPLTFKELLNLDIHAIEKLSEQPRPEDSMIIPKRVPEAVEWFVEIHKQAEKDQKCQQEVLELMLQNGWQIPDCVRRLPWIELEQENGLEACRITAGFYSAINANEYEIWHHIQTWARRNNYKNYQKLRTIVTFALETPRFVSCKHPLLKRFCPAGKCFVTELIERYERPYLFE